MLVADILSSFYTCLELLSVQSSAISDGSKDACKECPLQKLLSWIASVSFAEWWASTFSLLFPKQWQAALLSAEDSSLWQMGMWDLVDIKNHIVSGLNRKGDSGIFTVLSLCLHYSPVLIYFLTMSHNADQVDIDLTYLPQPLSWLAWLIFCIWALCWRTS